MDKMRMLDRNEEDDTAEVTWEDQERINAFSKLNNRVRAFEDKLEEIKQEREALEDLSTELELADEDELVLYKIGETFLHMPHSQALKRLEKDQRTVESNFTKVAGEVEECEGKMKALKVILYAKFGKAINLDE